MTEDADSFDVEIGLKELSSSELEMLNDMMRAAGVTSLEALAHLALRHYARHLQIGHVPADFMDFRLRLDALGKRRKRGKEG